MLIIMQPKARQVDITQVLNRLQEVGLRGELLQGQERMVIAVIGEVKSAVTIPFEAMDGVEKTMLVSDIPRAAARESHPAPTVIRVQDVEIGGNQVIVMAGPCAVEGESQIMDTAVAVKKAGAKLLRGGAFKPRTSPYSFQGLEVEGVKLLKEAGKQNNLPIVSEIMAPNQIDLFVEYVDVIQIGARNMQNFSLLKEVGRAGKPVLLKRGLAATIEEWLLAAEYILNEGNPSVILCERGIRTFETATRNTLDLSAVPLVKELSHLPIVVDPSHGTGRWRLVAPMAKAALAAGADGLLIEVHPHPERALSDGFQSLTLENFSQLMGEVRRLAECLGRKL